MAILFLTLSPGSEEPSWFDKIPHFDKVVHFSMFAIFSGLASLGWEVKKKLKKDVTILRSWIIGSGIVLAATTEMLQNYVPYRSADIWDWWADFLGLVVGLLTMVLVKKTGWLRNY